MIDKILSFGAMADWITPATALIQNVRGVTVGYNVDVHGGWSALAIKRLLVRHGVDVRGFIIFDGSTITFRVKTEDAPWAQQVMSDAGVPWVGGG